MPLLPNRNMVLRLHNKVSSQFYGDKAVLIHEFGTGSFDANNIETMQTFITDLACSFTDKVSMELWRDFADVEAIEAEIRFSGSFPKKGDKIKLTGRFDGTTYPDTTFEIVGIRNRDAMGWVCGLKVVNV